MVAPGVTRGSKELCLTHRLARKLFDAPATPPVSPLRPARLHLVGVGRVAGGGSLFHSRNVPRAVSTPYAGFGPFIPVLTQIFCQSRNATTSRVCCRICPSLPRKRVRLRSCRRRSNACDRPGRKGNLPTPHAFLRLHLYRDKRL